MKEEKTGWDRTLYILEAFVNDMVEAILRYIKGKSYGQDPSEFLKEQLGHWEENLKNHFQTEISKAKQETWDKAMDLVHEHDPSVGRSTSEAYWGNTLMKALKQAKEKDI